VLNSLHFLNTDIDKHCVEQDIEICVWKHSFSILNLCVLTLYRVPSGNFRCFLLIRVLDSILQLLYTHTLHIIICGDININYLLESEKKNQLDNLQLSYNLTSIIHFPTRVQNTPCYWNRYFHWYISIWKLQYNSYFKWSVWPWCSIIND
jgi:hypothetical protein